MDFIILPIGIVVLIFSIFIASRSLKFQDKYREKHNLKDNGLYFPISCLILFIGIAIGNFYASSIESSGINIFQSPEEFSVAVLIFSFSPIIGLLGGNISIFIRNNS